MPKIIFVNEIVYRENLKDEYNRGYFKGVKDSMRSALNNNKSKCCDPQGNADCMVAEDIASQIRTLAKKGGESMSEEKEIEDMDSEEFIAHVFYNVLGGLHANEEIDARCGILEMVEDIKQSREELRTRVAKLEAEAKMGNIPYKEAVELKKRVAELQDKYSDWYEFSNQCKKIEELQNRLSTVEAHESERKTVHEWLNDLKIPKEELGKKICLLRRLAILRDKHSTLLKASEGLEKALKLIDKDSAYGCARAKQALADFSAVKDKQ